MRHSYLFIHSCIDISNRFKFLCLPETMLSYGHADVTETIIVPVVFIVCYESSGKDRFFKSNYVPGKQLKVLKQCSLNFHIQGLASCPAYLFTD